MTGEPPAVAAARRAVALVFLANGLAFASWAARIPAVRERLTLSEGELGLALVGMTVGALGAFRVTGRLIARHGSRRVTRAASALLFAALPLPALAPTYATLVAALVVVGAGNGLMDVAMNAQAVEVERRAGRPILGSLHGMFSVGGLAGAALGAGAAALALPVALHLAIVGAALAAATGLAGRALIPDAPPPPAPADGAPAARGTAWQLAPLGAMALCSSVGEGAMADWSAVYLRSDLGTSPAVAAIGYAAFSLAMVIGRFTGDAWTRRFGAPAVLRVAALVVAGGLGGALVANTPGAMMIGFLCVGAGLSMVVPLVFRAGAAIPGLPPGQALATLATMSYGGFLAGPPAIGLVGDQLGLRAGLALIVPLALVIAALARRIAR